MVKKSGKHGNRIGGMTARWVFLCLWKCLKYNIFHLKVKKYFAISIIFHIFASGNRYIKMSRKTTIQTIGQSDKVGLYSIFFDGKEENEFREFLRKFRDNATLNKDFQAIVRAIDRIIANGALERYFRTEGKMADRVTALAIDSQRLRLYCLRISDQILIMGNGGVKDTRTYEESKELYGYVIDLQKFDELLKQAQLDGTITIEQTVITGIEQAYFDL